MSEDRAMHDPAPRDFNRTPIVPRICARVGCENTVKPRRKFCSSACFGISRRKPFGPISDEQREEMQAALDEARTSVGEVTS
ncbi:hypothetical protein K8W59_07240 [Nocardioides rotundus]|uniref:hypothetical protein n=1 Tax=Nocardioides rotundus TaxID=1774216 RepID=UPI001CC0D80B|nr:hypothetical protein [Nocardioides rotundus]UAL31246.1 hypothetical protein K8W59_07240 [Nocardioides rotundus]